MTFKTLVLGTEQADGSPTTAAVQDRDPPK